MDLRKSPAEDSPNYQRMISHKVPSQNVFNFGNHLETIPLRRQVAPHPQPVSDSGVHSLAAQAVDGITDGILCFIISVRFLVRGRIREIRQNFNSIPNGISMSDRDLTNTLIHSFAEQRRDRLLSPTPMDIAMWIEFLLGGMIFYLGYNPTA